MEEDLKKLQKAALVLSKKNRDDEDNASLLINKSGAPQSLAIVDKENEKYSEI